MKSLFFRNEITIHNQNLDYCIYTNDHKIIIQNQFENFIIKQISKLSNISQILHINKNERII